MRFEQHAFWRGDKMRRVVRYRLLRIASAFILHTKVNPQAVVDVQVLGSVGSGLFHKLSDVDLHVLFDPAAAGMTEETLRNLLDGKQQSFNLTHDIEAFNHHVEVYGQLKDEVNFSTNAYSLLSDEWLKHDASTPSRVSVKAAQMGFLILAKEISAAIEEWADDPKRLGELMDYIKALRKQGLERGGEMGVGNLIFKILRANGQIERVSDAKIHATDKKLSIGFKEAVTAVTVKKKRWSPQRDRNPALRTSFSLRHEDDEGGGSWDIKATVGGELAGIAVVMPASEADCASNPKHLHIEWIEVYPKYRRQGVGSALYKAIARFARKNGFTKIVSADVSDSARATRAKVWGPDHTDDYGRGVATKDLIERLLAESEHRGWFSNSDGRFYPCGGGEDHNDTAERIVRKLFKGTEVKPDESGVVYPSTELLRRGWLRTVSDHIFQAERLNGNTASTIFELIGDDKDGVFVCDLPGLHGRCSGWDVITHLENMGLV